MIFNEKNLIDASRSNNNNDYKNEVYKILSTLPGESMLLKNGALGKVLDIIWKLSFNHETRYILIRTKTNKSIQTFDERKIKQSIENTLKLIEDRQNIVCFFWFIGGDHLPTKNSHGGFRDSQLQQSFQQKLFKIQTYIQSSPFIKTAHANAFTNSSFLSLIEKISKKENISEENIISLLDKIFRKPLEIFLNNNFD